MCWPYKPSIQTFYYGIGGGGGERESIDVAVGPTQTTPSTLLGEITENRIIIFCSDGNDVKGSPSGAQN